MRCRYGEVGMESSEQHQILMKDVGKRTFPRSGEFDWLRKAGDSRTGAAFISDAHIGSTYSARLNSTADYKVRVHLAGNMNTGP